MQAGAAAARARPQLGPVATFLRTLTERIIELGPAKDAFQTRQCVNLHKLLVLPLYVAILYAGGGPSPFSQRFGPAAAVLLPIHAIYGMLWVLRTSTSPTPPGGTECRPSVLRSSSAGRSAPTTPRCTAS